MVGQVVEVLTCHSSGGDFGGLYALTDRNLLCCQVRGSSSSHQVDHTSQLGSAHKEQDEICGYGNHSVLPLMGERYSKSNIIHVIVAPLVILRHLTTTFVFNISVARSS